MFLCAANHSGPNAAAIRFSYRGRAISKVNVLDLVPVRSASAGTSPTVRRTGPLTAAARSVLGASGRGALPRGCRRAGENYRSIRTAHVCLNDHRQWTLAVAVTQVAAAGTQAHGKYYTAAIDGHACGASPCTHRAASSAGAGAWNTVALRT